MMYEHKSVLIRTQLDIKLLDGTHNMLSTLFKDTSTMKLDIKDISAYAFLYKVDQLTEGFYYSRLCTV